MRWLLIGVATVCTLAFIRQLNREPIDYEAGGALATATSATWLSAARWPHDHDDTHRNN